MNGHHSRSRDFRFLCEEAGRRRSLALPAFGPASLRFSSALPSCETGTRAHGHPRHTRRSRGRDGSGISGRPGEAEPLVVVAVARRVPVPVGGTDPVGFVVPGAAPEHTARYWPEPCVKCRPERRTLRSPRVSAWAAWPSHAWMLAITRSRSTCPAWYRANWPRRRRRKR